MEETEEYSTCKILKDKARAENVAELCVTVYRILSLWELDQRNYF